MRTTPIRTLLPLMLGCACVSANASATEEWASTLLGYSSQWSTTSWSAAQALGAPNTTGYGDISTAWAPASRDGTLEFITVGFATPTFASGALIRETWGNGFVYKIDAVDGQGALHTVWSGVDSSPAGAAFNFMPTWTPTAYLVTGLKIYTDTKHSVGTWEEIDAIKLYGNTVGVVPEPASWGMLALGLVLVGGVARRRHR